MGYLRTHNISCKKDIIITWPQLIRPYYLAFYNSALWDFRPKIQLDLVKIWLSTVRPNFTSIFRVFTLYYTPKKLQCSKKRPISRIRSFIVQSFAIFGLKFSSALMWKFGLILRVLAFTLRLKNYNLLQPFAIFAQKSAWLCKNSLFYRSS